MRSLITIISLSLLSSAVLASEVSEQLAQCRTVQNDLKRLVCYDKIGSDSFTQSVTREEPAIEVRSLSTNQLTTLSTDNFGVEHKEVTKNAATSMTASVIAIEKSKRGLWTIVLDNGQKWRQISSDGFIIRKGDNIIIERGVFDSFMLAKKGTERQTKVARLKD